jgi:hypothetical protein
MLPVISALLFSLLSAAGGIVVFDLRTRVVKWQQHLDLTTATTKFTAHMFSSPTLADIDADGHMEIVVGTSVGFVYVLDSKVRVGRALTQAAVQHAVNTMHSTATLSAAHVMAGECSPTRNCAVVIDADCRMEGGERHMRGLRVCAGQQGEKVCRKMTKEAGLHMQRNSSRYDGFDLWANTSQSSSPTYIVSHGPLLWFKQVLAPKQVCVYAQP